MMPSILSEGPKAIGYSSLVPLQSGGGLLSLAILFFVLAIVAAILGARGVAGLSMRIGKWLVIIFLVLAIVSLLL